MSQLVRLRRVDTSTPWGFRMNGGSEYGQPLYVQKVTSHSLAHRMGLHPGDGIQMIGNMHTHGVTHEVAKMEIIRNGNELDLVVQRDVVPVAPVEGSPTRYGPVTGNPRAEVIEEPSHWGGPPQDPNVQSRSFKILQQQLLTE